MTAEEREERQRFREMCRRMKAFLAKVRIFPLKINRVVPHKEDKEVGVALNSLLNKI